MDTTTIQTITTITTITTKTTSCQHTKTTKSSPATPPPLLNPGLKPGRGWGGCSGYENPQQGVLQAGLEPGAPLQVGHRIPPAQ